MIAVTFTMNLDNDAIHRAGNLDWWINYFNTEHDAFTDRDSDVTWPDIYAAIAMDYHTGGEWSDMVASTGVHVADAGDGPDIGTDIRANEAGAGPYADLHDAMAVHDPDVDDRI